MKPFESAKSRLASRLATGRRQRLAAAMLHRVLRVCAEVVPVADIHIVTPDAALLARAASEGFQALEDRTGGDLNAALEAARRYAAGRGYRRGLILPADLPQLTSYAVASVLAENGPVLVPDSTGRGTNALMLDPLLAGELAFGSDSFPRHCQIFGPAARVRRQAEFALDIDTPADLAAWIATANSIASLRNRDLKA